MTNQERIDVITERLQRALNPWHLEIKDDSHKHKGHEGAKSGGHFTLIIGCDQFSQQSLLSSHRRIYQILDDLMRTEIHALKIKLVSDSSC